MNEASPNSMDGKVVLVTGANSGIGRATALGLARLQASVVMLCRSAKRGERALRWKMRAYMPRSSITRANRTMP